MLYKEEAASLLLCQKAKATTVKRTSVIIIPKIGIEKLDVVNRPEK